MEAHGSVRPMPKKTSKKPLGKRSQNRRKAVIDKAIAMAEAKAPATDSAADHVPQRLLYALELIDSQGQRLRYAAARRALMAHFKISDTTAEADLRRAYAVLSEAVQIEAPHLAAKVTGMLWDVAVRADRAGEYSAAVAALAQLAKISGAHAPKKLQITDGSSLRTSEQRARIGELIEKARAAAAAAAQAKGAGSTTEAAEKAGG